MADDLSDPWGALRELQERVRRLEFSNPLENASVTAGRLRFIGGLLLIDSGGTLTVIGHFNGEGDFVWSGPWAFTGDGEITGRVDITGDLELLDDGSIRVGNILIKDGKIAVGVGGNQIVIDGATGKIVAGNMVIDPAEHGGAIKFANGAQVFTDGTTIQVFLGNSVVQISNDYARLQHGGDVIMIDGDGVLVSPGAVPTISGTGAIANTAMFTTAGRLRKADGS